MKQLPAIIVLILLASLAGAQSTITCLQYINQLQTLYNTSQAEFAQAMAPYLVFSGKIMDDMGFPISCVKNPSNAFWEVQVSLTQLADDSQLTMYYGFCFTNQCSAQALNQQSGFFIDTVFQNLTETGYQINSIQFYSVDMESDVTVGFVIVLIVLSLFVLSRMASSFIKWGKLCVTDSEEEALAVEMEEFQEDNRQAGRMPEHSLTFIDKYSLERALTKLFEKQQSNKIIGFSLFKIFSLPFIAFGYLFYLSNYGAYNYFSFNSQIYQSFFAKVATFAYYLPDIFYYISGFVFARKLIQLDEVDENNKTVNIFAAFARKIFKIYPVYLVILVVYRFITPSLHAGPLWNVYQQQIDQCNVKWWRSFIMIDNWFTHGCFSYSWYIQLEVQFLLLACIIFVIYAHKRVAALVVVYILLIASFVFVFAFGGMMPSSIQTATSDDAVLYFQAFYSHLFFYIFGIYSAFIFDKLSVRTFVRTHFIANQTIFTSMIVVAFALVIFIILRPAVWQNALSLELAFCRIGMMIGFLIFFLPSMAQDETNTTIVHKLSKLTYGIILSIGMVTACGFWGLSYFAYVDGLNLLQSSLTYLLLSIGVGGFLGVAFDITPFTFGR